MTPKVWNIRKIIQTRTYHIVQERYSVSCEKEPEKKIQLYVHD